MNETPAPAIPNCLGCRHYYVTWDPGFPYGCRAMDFKSRRRPDLDVLESSGAPCLRFEPKVKPVN